MEEKEEEGRGEECSSNSNQVVCVQVVTNNTAGHSVCRTVFIHSPSAAAPQAVCTLSPCPSAASSAHPAGAKTTSHH